MNSKSKNAYYAAHRHGFIDEICSHMTRYKNNFKLNNN